MEQYPTSAHLTACVITLASGNGDLGSGRTCLDLGCGTGMLSIGAAFCCDLVVSVDCDWDALEVARENAEEVDLDDTIQFIQAQVCIKGGNNKSKSNNNRGKGGRHGKRGGRGGRGSGRGGRGSQSSTQTKSKLILDGKDGIPLVDSCVDTVLTNPPFGTKHNAGIDVQFLRTATRLARRAVYSFHKRSTRAFLIKTIEEWGYRAEVAAEMEFDIDNMYQFHSQKTKDVEVDLIRVIIDEVGSGGRNVDENKGEDVDDDEETNDTD